MESTLSVTLTQLEIAAGLFLGYGRGTGGSETAWTAGQQQSITECVDSGLRQFLDPPPLPGENGGYDWSFLKPVAGLSLPAGADGLSLPDDFGGFDGKLSVSEPGATTGLWPLDVTGEGRVREAQDRSPTTGRPVLAAVVPLRGTTAGRGQRFSLVVWPTADRDYTLRASYYLHPDALSSTAPYPYGGAAHAETIKASVVAACELYLDDARGPRWVYFMERLAASVAQDRRLKPQHLGYNADRSSDGGPWNRWRHRGWGDVVVTVDGQEP